MMQSNDSQKGRTFLIMITLIVFVMQAAKLGYRVLVVHQWPTAGHWSQLALVIWLLIYLWKGKEWARVVSALYFSFATVVGAFMLCFFWHNADASLRVVSIMNDVMAAVLAGALWSSDSLRSYMAERRGGTEPALER